jgi:hypothetical protein
LTRITLIVANGVLEFVVIREIRVKPLFRVFGVFRGFRFFQERLGLYCADNDSPVRAGVVATPPVAPTGRAEIKTRMVSTPALTWVLSPRGEDVILHACRSSINRPANPAVRNFKDAANDSPFFLEGEDWGAGERRTFFSALEKRR